MNTTTYKNPIRLQKRINGGVQIIQGKSYIMLSRREVSELRASLDELIDDDYPERVDEIESTVD